jgi:hypothetical protein
MVVMVVVVVMMQGVVDSNQRYCFDSCSTKQLQPTPSRPSLQSVISCRPSSLVACMFIDITCRCVSTRFRYDGVGYRHNYNNDNYH